MEQAAVSFLEHGSMLLLADERLEVKWGCHNEFKFFLNRFSKFFFTPAFQLASLILNGILAVYPNSFTSLFE